MVGALAAGGFGRREVVVRVNGLDTPWGADDLAAIAAAGPDAVLVPKIRGPEDVYAYHAALGAARPETALWVMIETVQVLFCLDAVSAMAKTTRLGAMVMGINDLAKEMRARQTPDRAPYQAALALSVAAARTGDLIALDGVHNEIEDLTALDAVCRQGVDFGFDGKTLIHPSHLALTNQIFSPDPSDVTWARAVIAAFGDPLNVGKGALRVEGRLAERLHCDQAVALVALAEAIAASGS